MEHRKAIADEILFSRESRVKWIRGRYYKDHAQYAGLTKCHRPSELAPKVTVFKIGLKASTVFKLSVWPHPTS